MTVKEDDVKDVMEAIAPVVVAEEVSSESILDQRTIDLLNSTDSFFVQQQIRWAEAVTGGCIEQKNRYHIYDKNTNAKIIVVKEESEDCARCCCKPDHSLFAEFYHVEGDEPVSQPFMTMERDGCGCGDDCAKPCIGCFACNESCTQEAKLYAGPVSGKPGTMKGEERKNLLGSSVQPITGGGFKPVMQVMDRAQEDSASKTFAAARGPTCFGGCSELCCDTTFGLSAAKDGVTLSEIHELAFGDFATIKKLKPSGFGQAMREAFTDSDLYEVTFLTKAITAQQKANVLSTMIHLDYMFFELDSDMCGVKDGAFYINFTNCFCYGVVCPCKLVFKNNNS